MLSFYSLLSTSCAFSLKILVVEKNSCGSEKSFIFDREIFRKHHRKLIEVGEHSVEAALTSLKR